MQLKQDPAIKCGEYMNHGAWNSGAATNSQTKIRKMAPSSGTF